MKNPQDYSGCTIDIEDVNYFFGEGHDYPVNPFGECGIEDCEDSDA